MVLGPVLYVRLVMVLWWCVCINHIILEVNRNKPPSDTNCARKLSFSAKQPTLVQTIW
jgi:hypothetical protein